MDIDPKGDDQPSGVTQHTPSKTGIANSSFDFRFARPGPQLGPEAQRIMNDLREEALRIKAKLAAEKEEANRNGGDGMTGVGGRKIAQPKGKVGRFSDIHMAEFKRMDSIAGHPSSFRAQPGRLTPATTSLKRTQSKAKLDEREDIQVERSAQKSSLKRTQSKAKLDDGDEIHGDRSAPKSIGRVENTAPAKRARQNITDDTSSARPISRGGPESSKPLPSTPGTPRTTLPAAISTPTQSSLARSTSVKQIPTQIPSLSRSPSKPNLVSSHLH